MIRFAGVDLLLEDPQGDVSRFLDRHQNVADLRLFGAEPTYRVGACSIPNWPAPPPPRLNTLYWPTGATRWSTFLGLVNTSRKDEIIEAVGGIRGTTNDPAQLVIGDSAFDGEPAEDGFSADERNRVVLSTEMYLLPPRPISVPDLADETLWLIPLVDERYFWQYRFTEDFSPETWNAAFDGLETALDTSLLYSDPAIPEEYGEPTDESEWKYAAAPLVVDAVSAAVGRRFVRNVIGENRVLDADSSDERHTKNLAVGQEEPGFAEYNLIAGGDFSDEMPRAIVPASLVITFRDGAILNTITETASDHGVTNVTPDLELMLHTNITDSFSDGNDEDEPTTETAAIAAQIAADFYSHVGQQHDYTFAGVKAWHPSGFDDCVEWSIGRRRSDGSYEAQTRVRSLPYNTILLRPERVVSGCPDRSEIHYYTIIGGPTGGTFTVGLAVPDENDDLVTETITLDWDMTAEEVKTEFETHSEAESGDFDVTGGPFPNATISVMYTGNLAGKTFTPPIVNYTNLTGGDSKGVFVVRAQPGYPE